MLRPRTIHRDVGFTLVELLLVMAIIGVLISLLLPAIQKARATADLSVSMDHVRQISLAIQNYASDNNGVLPDQIPMPYLENNALILIAPADPGPGPGNSSISYAMNLQVVGVNLNYFITKGTSNTIGIAEGGAQDPGVGSAYDFTTTQGPVVWPGGPPTAFVGNSCVVGLCDGSARVVLTSISASTWQWASSLTSASAEPAEW